MNGPVCLVHLCTNRESIRCASSKVGEYAASRLIVDGRELFLTSVSGVKART